jgi:hypothetical protein
VVGGASNMIDFTDQLIDFQLDRGTISIADSASR